MTYGNAPRTQAEWDSQRAEVKEKAAKTVKANAKAALKARAKVLRVGADQEYAPVLEVTQPEVIAETPDEEKTPEVKPYAEWTNEELATELKARELPHSGNKDDLVARLEENDNIEQA